MKNFTRDWILWSAAFIFGIVALNFAILMHAYRLQDERQAKQPKQILQMDPLPSSGPMEKTQRIR